MPCTFFKWVFWFEVVEITYFAEQRLHRHIGFHPASTLSPCSHIHDVVTLVVLTDVDDEWFRSGGIYALKRVSVDAYPGKSWDDLVCTVGGIDQI